MSAPDPADLDEAIDRLAGADMTTCDRPMSPLVYAALADRNEGRLADEACRAVRVARGGKPRSAPDDRVLLSVLAASPPVGEEFALLRELRRRRVAGGELVARARAWMGVDVNEELHLEHDAGYEPSV